MDKKTKDMFQTIIKTIEKAENENDVLLGKIKNALTALKPLFVEMDNRLDILELNIGAIQTAMIHHSNSGETLNKGKS